MAGKQHHGSAALKGVLSVGRKAAVAYERPDLAERLGRALEQINQPNVNVVIVGEFKQGKSSLINALLNTRVCAVDDDIATAVPTVIRHGNEQSAVALTRRRDAAEDAEPTPKSIPFEEVAAYATERGPADPDVIVEGVEISLPRRILAEGLVLVDTPGVGGLGSAHATAALGALSVADAVIFTSDASQEFTRAELDFLAQAVELCPDVVCVLTKIDFYPSWRTVVDTNRGHLERAGFDVPILPVSSVLRVEAAKRKDRELNAESGFPAVVSWLADEVVAGATERESRRAQADLLSACDQLIGQFDSELESLNDPEHAPEVVSRLESAKSRSDRLRGQASRWNVTLTDGVSDLNADVEFDFKGRIRRITNEADARIDETDPLDSWAEFEPWLANRVSNEVIANYRVLVERAAQLSHEVGEHFEIEGAELNQEFDVHNPIEVLSSVELTTGLDLKDMGSGAKGLTMLRGSYTGILMFTMVGSLVGVALGPVAVGVGLLMGRKGLKDEKQRQLSQRRSQAKVSLRRYCDEVSFQVGKDSRDTLRRVHRQLRDHYGVRAEELHRSTSDSLKAASEAMQVGQDERAQRIRNARSELQRVSELRVAAERALVPTSSVASA